NFTAGNKVYDGTTAATILTRTLICVLVGDVASVPHSSLHDALPISGVGTGKTVSSTLFTLGGSAAGNYALSSVADTTANITTLRSAEHTTALQTRRDGASPATLVTRTLTGVLAGDVANVTATGGTAT